MNILKTINEHLEPFLVLSGAFLAFLLVLLTFAKEYLDHQVSIEAIKAGLEQNDKGLWIKSKTNLEQVDKK